MNVSASGSGGLSTSQINQMFKKLDTNGDGKIDKNENDAAISQMKNGSATNGANSAHASKMDEFFKKADSNGDGSLDKNEFTTAVSNMKPPQGQEGMSPPGAGGAPPAGVSGGFPPGAGGAPHSGKGGAKGSSASSSSTKIYDPADTNQDGKVSMEERTAYIKSQASKASSGSQVQKGEGSQSWQIKQAYGDSGQSKSSGTVSTTA